MNANFMNAVTNLTVADYEHIDQMCLILKARKKELRTEKSEMLKADKAAEKAAAKALKDEAKAAEKAEKDALKAAEKAAAKAIKDEAKAAEKAEKDAVKAAEKAEKDAKKAAEKAEKDAKKAAEKKAKTLEKLQADAVKHAKREAAGSPKAKNWAYQNFTRWAKGDDGPSEEEISAAGGRRDWLKAEWAVLTKEQQGALDAPWNVIA